MAGDPAADGADSCARQTNAVSSVVKTSSRMNLSLRFYASLSRLEAQGEIAILELKQFQ